MNNPLYKSLDKTLFQGEYVNNFGGWVPKIEFGSPIKSFLFHGSGEPFLDFPNITGFYKGNSYGVSQRTINPYQSVGVGAWNGNVYVAVGSVLVNPSTFTYYPLILNSYDTDNWFTASTPTLTDGSFNDVYWDGNKFIASKTTTSGMTGDNRSVFWYSADGITWSGDTSNYDRFTATTTSTTIQIEFIVNDTTAASNIRKNYIGIIFGNYKVAVSNDFGITWSGQTLTDNTGGTLNLLFRRTGDKGRLLGSRYSTGATPSDAEIYYNTTPAISTGWTRTNAYLSMGVNAIVADFLVDGNDYYALSTEIYTSPSSARTTRILKSSTSNPLDWNIHYTISGSYSQIIKIADEFYLSGIKSPSQPVLLKGNFDTGFQEVAKNTDLFVGAILPIGDNNI